MANSIADSIADHPVDMTYLLSYWATDSLATPVAELWEDHRLISSMFDISLLTSCSVMAVAWQSVGVFVNRLVGMGLNVTPYLSQGQSS